MIDFNNPSELPEFNQLQQFMLMGLQAKRFLDLGAPGLYDKEKKNVNINLEDEIIKETLVK